MFLEESECLGMEGVDISIYGSDPWLGYYIILCYVMLGTNLFYRPGVIIGGRDLSHDCGTSRSIGYFLEGLISLAPFAKAPLEITLSGITNDDLDISVDMFRTVIFVCLQRFGISEGLELKVLQRGAPPLGGGKVLFKCPVVKALTPLQLLDEGKINKLRGIAFVSVSYAHIIGSYEPISQLIISPLDIPRVCLHNLETVWWKLREGFSMNSFPMCSSIPIISRDANRERK
jgi:hypothetical protein